MELDNVNEPLVALSQSIKLPKARRQHAVFQVSSQFRTSSEGAWISIGRCPGIHVVGTSTSLG